MTSTRTRRLALALGLLCGTVVCAVLSMRRGPHHTAFGFALDALLLVNFWLTYRYNLNRRQRDTLIHLFPVPRESSKESS